ncbi:cupin domain-containing protein [Candidatus Woesearchaeota archaeon]|nr:MAG: cupin domain-containing protein [Candidatus Woesearchaeota archaeon]
MHKTVLDNRPWGSFKQYTLNERSTVKILTINANGKLSKQVHKKRDELWVILDKGIIVEIDDKKIKAKPGDEFFIPKNTTHRLSSKTGGRVLEISFGKFDENDIERIEDVYGRA